jgi:hypothetical protein
MVNHHRIYCVTDGKNKRKPHLLEVKCFTFNWSFLWKLDELSHWLTLCCIHSCSLTLCQNPSKTYHSVTWNVNYKVIPVLLLSLHPAAIQVLCIHIPCYNSSFAYMCRALQYKFWVCIHYPHVWSVHNFNSTKHRITVEWHSLNSSWQVTRIQTFAIDENSHSKMYYNSSSVSIKIIDKPTLLSIVGW